MLLRVVGDDSAYAAMVDHLLALHRVDEAFAYAVRARSRWLADSLDSEQTLRREAPWKSFGEPFVQTVMARWKMLSVDAALRGERLQAGPDTASTQPSALAKDAVTARQEFDALADKLAATSPAQALLLAPRRFDPKTLRQALAADTAATLYFTTPTRSIAFVVTRDAIAARELPISLDRLTEGATRRDLYKALLEPISADLAGIKRVTVLGPPSPRISIPLNDLKAGSPLETIDFGLASPWQAAFMPLGTSRHHRIGI